MSLPRRTFLAACTAVISGCAGLGGGGSDGAPADAENPAVGDVTPKGDLELSSPAFDDGGAIPRRYGRDGENVNPPLRVAGVPDGTASLTLIVDDPDAPGGTFTHWLVWNVDPSTTEIPEGWSPGGEGATVGKNDFGNRRYDGPDPPNETHTYRFKLYGLDATLDLPASAGKREVGEAMAGRVGGAAQLAGTYSP